MSVRPARPIHPSHRTYESGQDDRDNQLCCAVEDLLSACPSCAEAIGRTRGLARPTRAVNFGSHFSKIHCVGCFRGKWHPLIAVIGGRGISSPRATRIPPKSRQRDTSESKSKPSALPCMNPAPRPNKLAEGTRKQESKQASLNIEVEAKARFLHSYLLYCDTKPAAVRRRARSQHTAPHRSDRVHQARYGEHSFIHKMSRGERTEVPSTVVIEQNPHIHFYL